MVDKSTGSKNSGVKSVASQAYIFLMMVTCQPKKCFQMIVAAAKNLPLQTRARFLHLNYKN